MAVPRTRGGRTVSIVGAMAADCGIGTERIAERIEDANCSIQGLGDEVLSVGDKVVSGMRGRDARRHRGVRIEARIQPEY